MSDAAGLGAASEVAAELRPDSGAGGPGNGTDRAAGTTRRLTPVTTDEAFFGERVELVYDRLQRTLLSKHRDYGPRNIADAPGGPLNGLRVRIHDKVARINHLLDSDADPQHESLEDSFADLANYAVIAILVGRKQWPGVK